MVLNTDTNEKLLKETWIIRRVKSETYYIKSIFETDEYFLLVTDLRQVWFEHGDYKRIQQNALIPNIDIETKSEAAALLARVKQLFAMNWNGCDIRRSSKLEVVCDAKQKAQINTLCWIFNCDQLPVTSTEEDSVSAPQVIFDHFIQPSQAIINHFTDNLSDEENIKIKMNSNTSSLYSTTSLGFISDVINNKSSMKRKEKSIEPVEEEIVEEPVEETPLTKQELELKHKEDLIRMAEEERQRNPKANNKKRRKL